MLQINSKFYWDFLWETGLLEEVGIQWRDLTFTGMIARKMTDLATAYRFSLRVVLIGYHLLLKMV